LVLYYDAGNPRSFNPNTPNVVYDLSGHNVTGTVYKGVTYSSSNGGTFVFDGKTGYIGTNRSFINDGLLPYTNNQVGTIGSAAYQGSFTLEAWIRITGNPAGFTAINDWVHIVGNDSQFGVGMQISGFVDPVSVTRRGFNFGGRSTHNYQADNAVLNDTWYHFCCTREANVENRIYINGVLGLTNSNVTPPNISIIGAVDASSATANYGYLSYVSTYAEMKIGKGQGRVNQALQGNIAAVRIYRNFLTATEVERNFNAQKARFGY
jgi:hypothetical protein